MHTAKSIITAQDHRENLVFMGCKTAEPAGGQRTIICGVTMALGARMKNCCPEVANVSNVERRNFAVSLCFSEG